jgi:hypothetical protein
MLDPAAIRAESFRAAEVFHHYAPLRAARMPIAPTPDYLFVLVSIIIGLGISQVLTGVARTIVHRRRVRLYWVWAVAALLVFLAHVQLWWGTFSVGQTVAKGSFLDFMLFLLSPIAPYLSAAVVMPDFEDDDFVDLREHFLENHRSYFVLLALVPLLNGVRSLVISHDPLWMPARPFEAAFVLLLASGAAIRREGYQKLLAVVNLVVFGVFIATVGSKAG